MPSGAGPAASIDRASKSWPSAFPGARFRWLDIEEQADDTGDLDIENFPTLFIQRAELILFFGTMLPHLNHLQRTIETFVEQTPEW